jgi:sarcosine oxidase subunit beta
MGSDAEIVDERQLSEFAPRFRTSDVAAAVIEPGSGFADPGAALQSLVRAAVDAGVRVIPDEGVERLEVVGGRVVGVTTGAGRRLACDLVAVCAGAWSAGLVAPIGLELPIRPTAALPARFVGTGDPGPVAIDAPNGVYLRPWARGGSMAGLRDWSTRDLQGPDGPLPEVDAAFAARTLRGVGRRVRGAARGRFVGGDPGPLDMTPDGRPLLGPTALPGLWLSCGWSGTGFKTAPAAARALVDWMRGDTPPYPELAPVGAGAPTGSGQQDPTMR